NSKMFRTRFILGICLGKIRGLRTSPYSPACFLLRVTVTIRTVKMSLNALYVEAMTIISEIMLTYSDKSNQL
ncbi:hypothetical protein, partial [Fervidobacterium sp.]